VLRPMLHRARRGMGFQRVRALVCAPTNATAGAKQVLRIPAMDEYARNELTTSGSRRGLPCTRRSIVGNDSQMHQSVVGRSASFAVCRSKTAFFSPAAERFLRMSYDDFLGSRNEGGVVVSSVPSYGEATVDEHCNR
jgi:hypothetical protein